MNALALREAGLEEGPPARSPRAGDSAIKLLLLDVAADAFRDARIGDLPALLAPGDLLVVNDAATLPASLRGAGPAGEALELRLAGQLAGPRWAAVLFGAGDWRTPTEKRSPPAPLVAGDRLFFGIGDDALTARIVDVSEKSPRLIEVEFGCSDEVLLRALYRWGRPVQYSYLTKELALWDVQTAYAARPWALEEPSAGHPLRWSVLSALARREVKVVALTHAASLSSTGDAELDAALPFPERYEIPETTVSAIGRVHASGGRVVAVGTSVVRALESSAAEHGGILVAGAGQTDLLLGPDSPLRAVDGLLTGLHDPMGTHFALLRAFAPERLLQRAYAHARATQYLWHEFGDSSLILRR